MRLRALRAQVADGDLDRRLNALYSRTDGGLNGARVRLCALLDDFAAHFDGECGVRLYSSPGRTEIGGNHTDHQRGRTLAAAIDLDIVACARANADGMVRVSSKGHPEFSVDLGLPSPIEAERETPTSLVRGVVSRLSGMGYRIGGFDMCVESRVPVGGGLSSSAAFEVLLGVICNDLFCGNRLTPVQIAQIGQYAENAFFFKPCGLMDQLACATGGIAEMDFRSPDAPYVRKLSFDIERAGYALCMIDTGASHASLTEDYASIPREMRAVARLFGKDALREVEQDEFWRNLARVRAHAGDRAALRAMHFFSDDHIAHMEAAALERGDIDEFLSLVNRSGLSSALLLQNLYSPLKPHEQSITVAIAAVRRLLDGAGAVRVHGGGFAGAVQAFVPVADITRFQAGAEALLGVGCCRFMSFRDEGGTIIA
ncbi:MAG: galactokinase family protein [Clostridia bacterium]|nr:galactokinase family protein [Clostridia bacterium]